MIRRRTLGRPAGALAAAALAAGCAGGHPAAPGRAPAPAVSAPPALLVRVPRPDYASPASVTAAFFVAWASVDTVHDTPGSLAARCAPLSPPALERQLAGSQPLTAAWQQMRAARIVSLAQVRAVTCPDGDPTPTASAAYLRVYATWVTVTVTASGRTTASDGVTLRLAGTGGRWLVSAVLFY
jgi:hypothetical protein